MTGDFRSKTVRLKQGCVRVRTSGDITAVVWKDNHDMHRLTDIHDPLAEGNFCGGSGNALIPAIVENYK
jgi:hypothetical protein